MQKNDIVFPFSAVVGQRGIKRALMLNAVSSEVGGALIRGRRGTAKSTLARAVSYLLPEIEVVSGCQFSCDPDDIELLCEGCAERIVAEPELPTRTSRMKVVTLPLNATEEMIVGTLDIERALQEGEKRFEPGILARANRSILYIDEVNLLEDHLVDVLLDCAAMGVNVVEREGVSFRHSARFILVGTMNPEEGELRPQLEDRFGLCAEVDDSFTPEDRAEILRRNILFKKNPVEFETRWHLEQEKLREKLATARALYHEVKTPDEVLEAIANLAERSGADGHRADIAMVNAARAAAALEGMNEVKLEHLPEVAALALAHRVGKGPLGRDNDRMGQLESIMGDLLNRTPPLPGMELDRQEGAPVSETAGPGGAAGQAHPGQRLMMPSATDGIPVTAGQGPAAPAFDEILLPEQDNDVAVPGRRGLRTVEGPRGRYSGSTIPAGDKTAKRSSGIAIEASIRASALRAGSGDVPEVLPQDIRYKIRKQKCGASILFVVDASASMGAAQRLRAASEAILSLLVEAYQKRDRVGLIVFKDSAAQLVLNPTSSMALAARLLTELKPGGCTPLSHGLVLGKRTLERELLRNPRPFPVLVLISDGGGNVALGSSKDPISEALEIGREIKEKGISSVVLDSAPLASLQGRLSPARRLADAMGGTYYPAYNISGAAIRDSVDDSISRQSSAAL